MRKQLELEESLQIIRDTADPIKKLAAENPLVDFLYGNAFHITFNANDLFGWACADSVDVAIEDLPKMLEMDRLFGSDGVNALLSLIDQSEVQNACDSKKYQEAKEYLKGYRPCSWVH